MIGLAQSVVSTRQRRNEVLTGDVTAVTATSITVLVRGVSITAAYLRPYAPVVGDLVAVVRQDSSWLTLGALAGVGANAVQNFSFEQGGLSITTPPLWFLSNIAGTADPATVASGFAPAGTYELAVEGLAGAASTSYVYSSPISVATGEQWALSVLCAGVYPATVPPAATAGLYALWFANDTNLYPTTSAADTLVQQATSVNPGPGHTSLSGNVTVPAATTFMRVALRSTLAAGEGMLWDVAVARRIA